MKLRLRIAIMAFGMMLGATSASAADVPPPLPGDEPGSAALPAAPVVEAVKTAAPVAHKPIEKRELPVVKHGRKGAAKVTTHAHKVAGEHRNSHSAAAKSPKAAKNGKSVKMVVKPAATMHVKTGGGKSKKHR